MKLKFQFFFSGLLAGVLLSGVAFLIISSIQNSNFALITQPQNVDITSRAILQPLSPNEGKININMASIEELSGLPGIGPAKAAAIIDFRTKYGLFENIEELLYVPGIGESLYSSIKDKVIVE